MKSIARLQSATSLPRAPRDDAGKRTTTYLVMMSVRIVCFALMVLVMPYGWYTWIFGAGAIFLPYIAVVLANVGQDTKVAPAVDPERSLGDAPEAEKPKTEQPPVIRISETPSTSDGPTP
ncbi:DUF3099 domain-containing protein [Microbacterium sp. X-17]|uniref:DUF3099 domain-containing protein n=1 Tax=Microbacterium sp. X-17 TaxID=3144404 RepID=UPI0031F534CD